MSQLHAEPGAKHRPPVYGGKALGFIAVALAVFALMIAIGAASDDSRSDIRALGASINQLKARVTTMENAPGTPENVKALSDLVSRHINKSPVRATPTRRDYSYTSTGTRRASVAAAHEIAARYPATNTRSRWRLARAGRRTARP